MKTIEIEIYNDEQPGRPPCVDWIPEHELKGEITRASSYGLRVVVVGPVSWARQLARMENNPESI